MVTVIDRDEVAKYRDEIAAELAAWHAKNLRDIANCVATKTSMPEHYWHERDKLERTLRATQSLLEVLD